MDAKLKNKIKAVNRVFHEVEAESYDQRHPEIFWEREHWRDFCRKYLPKLPRPLKALDIGTGTGFVPGVLAECLEAEDSVVCVDISPEMLKAANEKLKNFSCRFEFVLSDGEAMDFLDGNSVDLVTVNSVLHHLPEYQTFFREADRVLKPGGILAVMHEPNQKFVRNGFLVFVSRSLGFLKNGFKRTKASTKEDLAGKIGERLVREGILNSGQKMGAKEIQSLVDIWSPTAGGKINRNSGFDPLWIRQKYFPQNWILKLLLVIDKNQFSF